MKTCKKCGVELNDGNQYPSLKALRRYICTDCWNKQRCSNPKAREQRRRNWTEWVKKHPDYMTNYFKSYYPSHREVWKRAEFKKYGITIREYESMLEAQKGQCAICKKSMATVTVDHDHELNLVRGLLCSSCNLALGLLHENIDTLASAIQYLKKWQIVPLSITTLQPKDSSIR